MLNLFCKNKGKEKSMFNIDDDTIVAMYDGYIVDLKNVPDEMFSKKIMGETIAFDFGKNKIKICSPANGTLSVLFPTGHAFGVTMHNGIELLIHIGINTIEANGNGFKVLNVKQGDIIMAGQPIVEVDYKMLSKKYNTYTMLIITNDKEKHYTFIENKKVKRGENLIKFI